MTKDEVVQFIEQHIKQLWTDWNPTSAQAYEMAKNFEPYTKQQVLDAIHRVRNSGKKYSTKTPPFESIYAECKEYCKQPRFSAVSSFAVLDDGFITSCQYQFDGITEFTDEMCSDVASRHRFYLTSNNHFINHGLDDVVVFVGDYKSACELSEQRKGGPEK